MHNWKCEVIRQIWIYGTLKNKDYEKMMEILFQEDDEVFLNSFDYPNACSYELLSQVCPVKNKKYEGQILSDDKLNIVCGSFYMIGKISF